MPELPPALVFGDDTGACLGAIRSLGRIGVPVHSAGWSIDLPAYRSRYCIASHLVPRYEGDGAAWVASVRTLIDRHAIALLVPTSDSSVAQLAAHAHDFAPAHVAAPSPEALDLFGDKYATRQAAQRLGIPVAPGLPVTRQSDSDALIATLGLPIIVKARRSYELGAHTQKSTVALAESRDALARRIASAGDDIAEGFLPGFCRGVSVLAVDGAVVQAFQHRRLRQKHATGPSSWRVSERLDPRLLAATEALVADVGYSGIAMFEFRCGDDSDDFALLEVNPRAWGSMQLAADAGADYIAAQYRMMIEDRVPPQRLDFSPGLQKLSLWGEFEAVSHKVAAARGWVAKLACARQAAGFATRLITGRGFDSFAPDDRAPFKEERAQVLARIGRKLTLARSGGTTIAAVAEK